MFLQKYSTAFPPDIHLVCLNFQDSEDGGKDEEADLDTPEVSSPDSTKPKMKAALKKTPTMIATIKVCLLFVFIL